MGRCGWRHGYVGSRGAFSYPLLSVLADSGWKVCRCSRRIGISPVALDGTVCLTFDAVRGDELGMLLERVSDIWLEVLISNIFANLTYFDTSGI